MIKVILPLVAFYFLFIKKSGAEIRGEEDFSGFVNFIDMTTSAISGINNNYDSLFLRYGQQYGVDPKILKAISANESYIGKYKNTVTVNGRTTGGLMHIELPTAQDYIPSITAKELVKPENEIKIAAMHVRKLLDLYDGDIELVTRAYNGGMGRVREFINGTVNSTWKRNTTAYYGRFKRNYNKLG